MKKKTLSGKMIYFILVLSLLASVLAISCAKQAPAPAPTPVPTPKPAPTPTGPQSGGILKIIAPPGLTNIGYPGKAYTAGGTQYVRPAVEFLLSFDPKGTGNYVPQLATGWQWSSDYLHLTLTLRQGVKFQDGTDFNAEAVKYNLDLQRVGARAELKSVTSIDVIDNYTVRLNLSSYSSAVLQGLCSLCGWIVSPTGLKTMGDDAQYRPIGTGPFKFVSYDRDISLKFAKWDGYWQKGKPYLDNLEFVFIKDPVTQLVSFKAGEEQVIKSVNTKDVADLQAAGKYNLVSYPSAAMGMAGDSAHPSSPFADIRVRRALAYAIDNEAIAKAVGLGMYKAINQPFDPSGPYYNPKVVGYPYNPQKAKQLLADAGYPNGFDTTIIFESTNSDEVSMFSAVQGYLSAVGIKAKLDAADAGRFLQVASGGWNNHLIYHWAPIARGVPPATTLNNGFIKKASRYDTKSLWIPDDYDAKYWVATGEPDPVKATAMFQDLSKIIIDDYCLSVPIMAPFSYLAKTQNVKDLDMLVYAMSEWLPENAWLSK